MPPTGVWEFISSQDACNIVYKHWKQGPRKAADALVAESVKRWNLEEDVVSEAWRGVWHRCRVRCIDDDCLCLS